MATRASSDCEGRHLGEGRWEHNGSGPDQFSTPAWHRLGHAGQTFMSATAATTASQVYDTDLNFKKSIGGVGAPWSVQVTPQVHL